MVKQTIRVMVQPGIHFRPAGKITEVALQFQCAIIAKTDKAEANVKSFLNLLAAGIKCNDEIELICEGVDEEEALKVVGALFKKEEIK